jgi:hypothetical protein
MKNIDKQTRENFFVRLMSMDDAAWERHANPLSVWSRVITGLPVTLFSVWSIKLFGWWSLVIICAALMWIWLNPRLFPAPRNRDNWASKVTFGERVWLNRTTHPIPKHHAQWAIFLSVVAGVGFFVAVVGAYMNLLLPTLAGGLTSWFGKMWFCDRMVWLHQDMEGDKK